MHQIGFAVYRALNTNFETTFPTAAHKSCYPPALIRRLAQAVNASIEIGL